MPLAAPAQSLASPAAGIGARYRLGPMIAIVWLALAAGAILTGKPALESMSTDDLMRLVMVRDLLAGQSWFDVTQYRLNPPEGVVMHWSRIADLPAATLILALTPLLGRSAAEFAAIAFVPALMLLPVLALTAHIAGRLGGRTAALTSLLLVAVAVPVLIHFRPGALDHHGLQLLLLLAATAGAMERERSFAIAGGGLAAAASLAVGLEMLPAIAALLAAVGLRWAIEGPPVARATVCFGLSFATGAALLFAATAPPSAWRAAVCDAFALPWLTAASLSGGALALLAATGDRLDGRTARIAAAAAAGATVAAVFAAAFPACLGNPYAQLDPRLAELWLNHVREARNVFAVLIQTPENFLPLYGAPLAALVLGSLALRRAPPAERMTFMVPLFAVAALTAVSFWQLRGAPAANLLAQAVLAASLVRLIGDGTGRRGILRLLAALVAVSVPFLAMAGHGMGALLAAAGHARSAERSEPETCSRPGETEPLLRLPQGIVLSTVDLGPVILAGSPHSVLAAPYHRNDAGLIASFDMLSGSDANMRNALAESGVRYVAICPGAPDQALYERIGPAGLAARLGRGEIPDFLEAIPPGPDARLRVFRVVR